MTGFNGPITDRLGGVEPATGFDEVLARNTRLPLSLPRLPHGSLWPRRVTGHDGALHPTRTPVAYFPEARAPTTEADCGRCYATMVTVWLDTE